MGKDLRGKIFVGFMLLGIGIGMIFDKAGAGCLIGMGIGFIISSFIKDKDEKSASSQFWKILLGLFFIFLGASMLLNYETIWEYVFPALLILLGLSLILSALK
jgi:NhaP-type Na+/H+ or K+/H+ antiporter